MNKTIGIVAGSYDPVTWGHIGLFRQAVKLVNELHIVVGVNPSKRYMLADEVRLQLVTAVLDLELTAEERARTHIHYLQDDLLVHFADELGATHLIRGIRNSQDLFYEENIAGVNAKIAPHIQTVYMMTTSDLACVSSSAARELLRKPRWQKNLLSFVHPLVLEELAKVREPEGVK